MLYVLPVLSGNFIVTLPTPISILKLFEQPDFHKKSSPMKTNGNFLKDIQVAGLREKYVKKNPLVVLKRLRI